MLVGCTLFLGVMAASALVGGWIVMLLCGVLWHEFGWLEPIGYWPSVGLAFCLSFVGNMIFGARSK